MKGKLKSTIVLCTYNGEKYLEDLLNSLENQTRLSEEIIISDDGSKDNTWTIVENFKKIYPNKVILIRNKNSKGASKNFIETVLETSGDIVFFCDQDDIWQNDKVEKMMEIMEKEEQICLLASNLKPLYMFKPTLKDKLVLTKQHCNEKLKKVRVIPENLNIKRSGCTMCFRTSFFKEIYPYWFQNWYHDDFLWKTSVMLGKAAIFNHFTVYRRIHQNNTSINVKRNLESRIEQIYKEIEFIDCLEKIIEDTGNNSDKNLLVLKKFKNFQIKRIYYLKNKNIINLMSTFLLYGRYYRTKAQFLLDCYFILKKDMKKERKNEI